MMNYAEGELHKAVALVKCAAGLLFRFPGCVAQKKRNT